jgi:ABC-type phosphate transport system substrate-binding protein
MLPSIFGSRASLALCAVTALALAWTWPSSAVAEGQKLVVVVAKGSPIKSLTKSQLKRTFLGEAVTEQKVALVPFNSQPGSPPRATFDQAILGMSPAEVGRYWVDRKVRAQSGAPRSLPSMAHVLKVVAKFPGAISYVPADQLTAALQPVAIDGVAHTDAKYPLKVP